MGRPCVRSTGPPRDPAHHPSWIPRLSAAPRVRLRETPTISGKVRIRSYVSGRGMSLVMRREWAMPNGDTFSIAPIAAFLDRWLEGSEVVIDPFARSSQRGTVTNDLNPSSAAQFHMDARDFLTGCEITADAVLFDPPYSPRQISELYQSIGRSVSTEDTQNARLYKAVRDLLDARLRPGGVALSFGWNSAGFGTGRGYELVAHGGAHNDTICVAERKARGLLL